MSPSPKTKSASAALQKTSIAIRQTAKGSSYPKVSSIPKTSKSRLARAADGVLEKTELPHDGTVLYLAYGSNMCAKTFLGVRGIRPLSRVKVSVPSLRLTFDLPGVPYFEPCFANVEYRDLAEKDEFEPEKSAHREDMEWDGGLIGVVYEVTQEDYRTILRTEGAGSSYKEIIVPCFPIGPKDEVALSGPGPFLAKTLFAAHPACRDPNLRDRCWWQRFREGCQRSSPSHAQASLRYLNLLRAGGKEHSLPASYQRYLESLHPYVATRWAQKVGRYAFLGLWGPHLIFFLAMTKSLADETGELPSWLARIVSVMSNVMWLSYDVAFKPIFGDGERAEESGLIGVFRL